MPTLLVLAGGLDAKSFSLAEDRITIGRAPDNTVILDHTTVSKSHAMLVKNGGDYKIFDLHSTNGTHVNDDPVVVTALHDGDEIQMGDITLRYQSDGKKIAPTIPVAQERHEPATSGPTTQPAPSIPQPTTAKPPETLAPPERTQRIPLPFAPTQPPPPRVSPISSPQRRAEPAPQKPPAPPVTVLGSELRSASAAPPKAAPVPIPAMPAPPRDNGGSTAKAGNDRIDMGRMIPAPAVEQTDSKLRSTIFWMLDRLRGTPMPADIPIIEQPQPRPPAKVPEPYTMPATESRSDTGQKPVPLTNAPPAKQPVAGPELKFKTSPPQTDQRPKEEFRLRPKPEEPKAEPKKAESLPKEKPPSSPEPQPAAPSGKKRLLYVAVFAAGLLMLFVGYPIGAQSFKFLGMVMTVMGLLCLIFDLKFGSVVAPPRKR